MWLALGHAVDCAWGQARGFVVVQMFGLPHFASNYCFLSFSTAVSAWALATKLAGLCASFESQALPAALLLRSQL